MDTLLQALALFTPGAVVMMLVGALVGLLAGIIPGLGGMFALALLVPVTYTMDPFAALGMLLAASATINTGNGVTSILFGVPGSAGGVASILDGHPLAKRGQADRAMAASFTAALVGGIFGAIVLAACLPFVRPVILAFGPSEFFALIVFALILVSGLGGGDRLKALFAGLAGLMVAMVGQESSTGTLRYTFGSLYLWDGVQLIPILIGLFAISEMFILLRSGASVAPPVEGASQTKWSGTLRGVVDVFKHPKATLISSASGVFVGLLPGLGAETAQFVSYGQVKALSKNGHKFGTGEIEGVIAADASGNSKDGGALVPTLLFGIPGSAPQAILLAAMIVLGIQPGKEMLGANLHVTWYLVLILVFVNILATLVMLLFARRLGKLTQVSPRVVAPIVLVISVFGAYAATGSPGDIITVLAFGAIGVVMVKHGYSRTTFTIGLVLGGLLEQYYLIAMQVSGWRFLLEPIALVLFGLAILVLLLPVFKRFYIKTGRARSHRRVLQKAGKE